MQHSAAWEADRHLASHQLGRQDPTWDVWNPLRLDLLHHHWQSAHDARHVSAST